MTLKSLLWLFAALGAAAASAAEPIPIETAPERVTLFIDGAQVTRKGQVDLPAGNTVLLFKGLSPYLDDKSVQVSARGAFTITSVNRLYDWSDSLRRSEKQEALTRELKRIEQRQRELKAEREVLDARYEMLKMNCSAGNRTAATPLAAIRELNEYYAAGLQELKRQSLELDREAEALDESKQRLKGELAQAGGRRDEAASEVEVRIEAKAPCKGDFTLTYYVRNAGWFPTYDIRSEGLTSPLEIVYKAHIFQNTREEWKEVALTLSSSNPTAGNIAPELKTWWLDYGLAPPQYDRGNASPTVEGVVFDEQRKPLVGVSVSVPGTTVGALTDANGRYSLTLPTDASQLAFRLVGYKSRTRAVTDDQLNVVLQPDNRLRDKEVVVAYGASAKNRLTGTVTVDYAEFSEETADRMEVETSLTRTDYRFEIKQPYTLPSDGRCITAEIGRYRLPAVYRYRATPKIDRDAFLTAEATGWEELNLLEGEANVYFERTFVGKSILSPARAADTLRFSLGRDQSVRIERTRESDFTRHRTFGSNRTQRVGWKIAVHNTRNEPVSLTLSDQLPVSRNSAIEVTAEELSGGRLAPSAGTVEWRLDLRPGEVRELRLRYTVKYPKERGLIIE